MILLTHSIYIYVKPKYKVGSCVQVSNYKHLKSYRYSTFDMWVKKLLKLFIKKIWKDKAECFLDWKNIKQ